MNTLKQLFRQPVRTVAALLLLCVASSFLSLGVNLRLSAEETARAIEGQFVTIGVPTTAMRQEALELGDGSTAMVSFGLYDEEAKAFVEGLPEIKGAYRQQFISAYIPQVNTLTTAAAGVRYRQASDRPYEGVMLVVTPTEIVKLEEDPPNTAYYDGCINFNATVDQVLALHPTLKCWERQHISYDFTLEKAVPIELGERYLLYSSVYIDDDLDLRRIFAQLTGKSVEDFKVSWLEHEGPWARNKFESGSIIVQDFTLGIAFDAHMPRIDGQGYYECSLGETRVSPMIVRLEGSVEDFLASEEGALWARFLRQLDVQYHSVPVLGTDLLESMYEFHQGKSFITQGRTFSEEDYARGNRVCLISESMAAASGLSVGDAVDLNFYWGPVPTIGGQDELHKAPAAQEYSELLGFSGEPAAYEIVGLYRQSDQWSNADYSFGPNTVFVPNASIGQPTYCPDEGLYYTIVIENGRIEEVKEAIRAGGYTEELLYFFDRGYDRVAGTLEEFRGSAGILLWAACATWGAALLVYVAIFVFHQRRNAGLMRSLGAGKTRTAGFVWCISMLPALMAVAVGAVAGTLLTDRAAEQVLSTFVDEMSTDFSAAAEAAAEFQGLLTVSPWGIPAAAGLQAAVFALVVGLCALLIASRKPLRNLKGAGR